MMLRDGIGAAIVQPLRFGTVGVLNTATDFVLFLILASISGAPALSNVISFSCGAAVSYMMNRNWTFDTDAPKKPHRQSLTRFILLTLVMIVISTLVLLACATFLSLAVAKLVSVCVVAGLSFLGMKYLVFRPQAQPGNPVEKHTK